MRPIVLALLLSILPLSAQAQVFRRVPTRQPVYVQPRLYRPAPPPPAERAAAAPAPAPVAAAEPLKDPHLNVPLAAEREIARLGDGVQEIGIGHQGAASLWMAAIAAPPPDDSHKWYITVITKRNCVYCQRLLEDFARDPNLRAFADPREYEQSWAHFNVFSADDATQTWRWAKIRVEAYPTLILQPPLNRKFGDSKTVVLQKTGYDGDPTKLAEEIRQAIKYYVARLNDGGHQQGGFEQAIVEEQPIEQANPKIPPAPEPAAAIGIDPPFPVPVLPLVPGPDTAPLRPDRPFGPPVIPRIVPDSVRPKIVPEMDLPGLATIVSVLIAIRWACNLLIALLTSGGITNFFLLLILLVLLIRLVRARRALDLVIDDSLLQRMATTLAAMLPRPAHRPVPAQTSRPSPVAASPSVPPAAQEKQRPTISRARVRIR